jgi:hypothetical protein
MNESHTKALDKLVSQHKANPDCLALILCGSLATRQEKSDSDVDLYVVLSDQAMEKVHQTKLYFSGCWDPSQHFGVEVDGKLIGLDFLRQAATRGSEPTRASFRNAYTLFSRDSEIDALIPQIAVYPETEQLKRARTFWSYVHHFRYVGEDACRKGNTFHYRHCVLELIFFTGRLILAHNRVLYPCHKSLLPLVAACDKKPEGILALTDRLMETFLVDEMLAYYQMVDSYFTVYNYPDDQRVGMILENEWTWYTGKLTAAEW